MKTIIVDDEKAAVEVFKYEAEEIEDIDIEGVFYNWNDALEYGGIRNIDLAFLDIELGGGMNGLELASRIRDKNPDIMFIFITGDESYAMEAIKHDAAGYIVKPYSSESLRYAVETARLLSKRNKKRIVARTFGYFDLFIDERPVMFKSGKAKELLAMLVDRQGGTVTTDQIIGTLWEDRPNDVSTQNLCCKICKTLQKELDDNGIGDLLITARGVRSLDISKFDCDLYKMLDGNKHVADRYIGEYMMEYSWAENRAALLDRYLPTK
ncbi:MAG: response regulator [Lachnospiraceae bacterium]|nr:response regulator [Lachnospiraceae bacterium]